MLSSLDLKAKRRLEMDGVSCSVKRRRLSSASLPSDEGSQCHIYNDINVMIL